MSDPYTGSAERSLTRRAFIKSATSTTAAAIIAPTIITAKALADTNFPPRPPRPNNKIQMVAMGLGPQGASNMGHFLENPDVQVIAVCDVNKNHLDKAKNTVDRTYDNQDCKAYTDYRDMMDNHDIDAMSLGLPDHWHAIPVMAAAEKGIDCYGEKPFSHSLTEGRAMVDALNQNRCIWQTGSWQRSLPNFHRACELVRNGRIGKVQHVEVGLSGGYVDYIQTKDKTQFGPPPAAFDYDLWLGPAKKESYCPARVHRNWRWNMAYGGGKLMDWIGHHGDIAHWGLGLDNTGPAKISGTADIPNVDKVWDAPTEFDCTLTYQDGLTMNISSTKAKGTKWIGYNGWIFVTRKNTLEASDLKILEEKIGEKEIHLYRSADHWKNFIDCIKTRNPTITPAETAHRSASLGHFCNIAMYTNRIINWDPRTETIINDKQATDMLMAPYRKPWKLE